MNAKKIVISEADFERLNEFAHSHERVRYGPLVASLKRESDPGKFVAPTRVPKSVVTMNSRVRIRDIKSGERVTYSLVYRENTTVNENELSVLAPLGRALLGATAGDVVDVHTPGGVRKIKVERILYQPEAAGDFHL